ncbi:hypothetical protein Tco_0656021 [Tanacetum coccineum]|uniref:Uncharacterized protein n=1 Tax=Tanacetum coccineum TaxID=301880 RepID=A0ABQ4X801_9ASTR
MYQSVLPLSLQWMILQPHKLLSHLLQLLLKQLELLIQDPRQKGLLFRSQVNICDLITLDIEIADMESHPGI